MGSPSAGAVEGVGLLGDRAVVPGRRVGSLELGMPYRTVLAMLGPGLSVARGRLAFARYAELGVQLVLRTSASNELTADARVIAIEISDGEWTGMPRLRVHRDLVDGVLGAPTVVGERALYPAGVSVQYGPSGDAVALAVRAPLEGALFPAPISEGPLVAAARRGFAP
ncbi:hypothetical protein BH11MYX4_BH11MYX4_48590 [soil metagenome]